MRRYFKGALIAVAVIALQYGVANDGNAQSYSDILKQVSSPTYGASADVNNNLPTLNSVFQQGSANHSVPNVPSIVVPGGPAGAPQAHSGMMPGSTTPMPGNGMSNISNGYNQIHNQFNNGQMVGMGQQVIHGQSCNQMIGSGPMIGGNQCAAGAAPVNGYGSHPGVAPVLGTTMQPRNIYAPAYTAPVYVPGQNFGMTQSFVAGNGCATAAPVVAAPVAVNTAGFVAAPTAGTVDNFSVDRSSQRNLVFGLNALIFDRDYEDDLFLVRNPANESLLSTDADVGNFGGVEFFLGSRNCNGNGIDLRYWGLFTDEASYSLAGASFSSYLPDLANVTWPANGRTIDDVINGSTLHTITRDNEIHNIEFNSLRNGGCFTTRGGRCGTYELLGGFRWFEFDETFHWDVTSPTAPLALFFDHEVKNTLLGFQFGGNTEICLTNRLRLTAGTKLGIFNNRSRVLQRLSDDTGTLAIVDGVEYSFRDSKNDLSMLGELNLGTALNFNACSRLNIGYRAIGVSGIALAPNQLGNTNYAPAIRSIQSNANLLLHGAVFGLEFCR